MDHGFHKTIFNSFFLLLIKKMFLEQQISTVEGPCETEDWSNDAENSALHHRNKLQF